MRTTHGRLAIVIAAILWSTGGAAIKLSDANAPTITVGRAVFAAIALFLIFPRARIRPNIEIMKGALAYAATCALFVWANTLTTAGNAIFIQNIAPVWVLLASPLLLGEKPSVIQLISLPISLIGCALFFADDLDPSRTHGNLVAFGASFSYATLIISYRSLNSDQGLAATLYGNLLIIVICLPMSQAPSSLAINDWLAFAYLGIVQQALPAVIFITAIRSVRALEAALLLLLEPLFSPVWAFLILKERLGRLAILGAVIVLITAIGRNMAENWSSAGSKTQKRR
jgi:drug/metabolite transporter, DME family